jgi:formate hydrogenlyase subunit 5
LGVREDAIMITGDAQELIREQVDAADLTARVASHVEQDGRFAGMVGEVANGEHWLHILLVRDSHLPKTRGTYFLLTCPLLDNPPTYPTLVGISPAAAIFEREVHERFGFVAQGHETPPLLFAESTPENIAFSPQGAEDARSSVGPQETVVPQVDAPGAFQFSVGPVRSGVTEAQQFIFETVGEEMLHLTTQLYYKHRGVETACEGRMPQLALPLIERLSGRSSFAHGLAFCQAAERICRLETPPRARYLRSLWAELERLYSHFHDLSDLCNCTSIHVLTAQWAWLKEQVLTLNTELGASRYLRDINAVGGVRLDLTPTACLHLEESLKTLEGQFIQCARLSKSTYSHIQRLEATGVLSDQAARDYACVGPVARACGLEQDVRRNHPYAAYAELDWHLSGYSGGDALARMEVRLQEIEQSFQMIRQCADWLQKHPGDISTHSAGEPEWRSGVDLGWAETPRGEALHFVRLTDEGRIARVKFRTPSLVNWQPFSLTIAGIMMPDFAVNKASWNLSVAGNDM